MSAESRLIIFSVLVSSLLSYDVVYGTELTFELEDNTETCFNEMIGTDVPVAFDFQVINGGNLDVDVVLEGPNQEIIYKRVHEQYDTIHFKTNASGEYVLCFSNQFSTFTHKTVFFSFVAGEEKSIIPNADDLVGPLTFLEATSDEIHKSLNAILDTQTHYRLQEASSRRFAEDLSERVLCWSLMQTFIIIALSISQVLILRNFFTDTMPKNTYPVQVRQPRYAQL